MYNILQSKYKIDDISTLNFATIFRLLAIVTLFLSSSDLFSQASGGGYAEPYMYRNVGTRQIGLAGAYTAIANDPATVFYNPAGLGFFSNKPQVALSASSLGLGRKHASIAWGQSIYPNVGVGAGINSYMSGSFMGRDIKGNPLGDHSNLQYSLNLSGAYSTEFASLGITAKYLTNNLTNSNTYANGFAVDIGTKVDIMNLFSVGVAVQNISGMMFWNNIEKNNEFLPYRVRAGLAMEFGLNEESYSTRTTLDGELSEVYVPATRYILVSLDALMQQYVETPSLVIGVEAALHEMFALRAGFDLVGDDAGVSKILPMNNWGAGFSIRPNLEEYSFPFKLHIDYSVSNEYLSSGNIAHHVSFCFEF